MDVHKDVMSEFLGVRNGVFVVPVYQRNYDWGESQCRRLFQDMRRAIATGKQHFLGTICFKTESDNKRFVVDGQQRLTSTTLLMKALKDYDDRPDVKYEIEHAYLKNSGISVEGNEFAQFKLHLNGNDDILYRKLLSCDRQSIDEHVTDNEKDSGIYRNYVLFYNLIKDFVESGAGSVADLLKAMERLVIVSLILDSENAQEIFESLNSTGLDLSPVDLLRNNLLMRFSYETQVEFYDKYWRNIELAVGKENMQQFLMSYLIAKRKHHQIQLDGDDRARTFSAQKLLPVVDDALERFCGDGDKYDRMKNLFSDMLDSARLYKDLIFLDDFVPGPGVPVLRRTLYHLTVSNKFTSANSLVLYIMRLKAAGRITQEDLESACRAVLSMVFRCKVCRRTGITSQFVTSVILKLMDLEASGDWGKFLPVFWSALTSGKGLFAFPSDAEFTEALTTTNLYARLRSDGMKYLLYMLEEQSSWKKGLPAYNDPTISIEHVMPQTLSYAWKSSMDRDELEQYGQLVHTLGNLALTSYNSEMSNKSFNEKRDYYLNSNFYYTKKLGGHDSWHVSDIEVRGIELAEAALNVWPLPAEYRPAEGSVSGSLHKFDEDPASFTHFKPLALLLEDFQMPVSTWADMLVLLAEHMSTKDLETMTAIARSGDVGALVLSDADHGYKSDKRYKQVADRLFIHAATSTADKMRNMEKIVREFDRMAGTDLMNSIMFSVK